MLILSQKFFKIGHSGSQCKNIWLKETLLMRLFFFTIAYPGRFCNQEVADLNILEVKPDEPHPPTWQPSILTLKQIIL